MLWWLVVGVFCATTTALRLHEHTPSSPKQCVDLQCPTTSFDYGRKKLVDEETLSETPCRDCQQCTAAGYSVCLKPRLLNRAKRESLTRQMPTCSCAHSVPANCHNELARTTHPANITMQLYNVCYASSLQAPAAPLAVNSKKNVIVTVEPFWEEPYWKELDLANLTLAYSYTVKSPEHCDGDVMTKENGGEATHLCTAQLKIGMSTNDRTGEEEYEHSENFDAYDDEDLPPEVDFDRDVFAGAKFVNFFYKVSVRRPRQLRIRSDSSDPFEDTGTVVESETLVHDMKPEIYGTGLEEAQAPKETMKAVDKKEKSEEREEKEKPHDDTPSEGEQIDEEAVSQEEGEGPENVPGTDFFNDDLSKEKTKEMTEEEKKEDELEQKEEEEDEKEAEQIADEERREQEAEDKDKQIENNKQIESAHDKESKDRDDKTTDAENKEKSGETEDKKNGDEKEKSKEVEVDAEKEEESKETKDEDEKDEGEDEKKEGGEEKKEGDGEEKKEDDGKTEPLNDDKQEGGEDEKEDSENASGSGSDESGEEDGNQVVEATPWYQFAVDFFAIEPRLNLARWVFLVTIVACTLLICTVCLRRRCVARNKRHQKTANGVRYEAAATSATTTSHLQSSTGGGHQLGSPLMPLIDPEMAKEEMMETSIDEISYRYNSATLSLKNLAANDLEICALIGRGRFGSIHRGMLHMERGGMRDVTVYWLQAPGVLSSNEMRVLVRGLESGVQATTATTHISIHGISYNNEASLVVLDPLWEPDLRAVLRESRSARFASENLRSASFLSAERLFSIMKEISTGVKVLVSKKVFHASLCAANILVGERGHIKISGFGLAEHRSLTARKDEKNPRLIRWQSPRVLGFQTEITRLEEADLVWSLGILLWEIVSLGGTPYAKIRNESELRVRIPNETARIEHPSYVDLPLRQLIDDCVKVDATRRIDLESLVKRIDCLALDAQKQLLLVLPFNEDSGGSPMRRRGSSNRAETFEYSPIVLPLE